MFKNIRPDLFSLNNETDFFKMIGTIIKIDRSKDANLTFGVPTLKDRYLGHNGLSKIYLQSGKYLCR